MTLQDKATGEVFLQNLSYITDYFEEICFKFFVFKTPFHDHCEKFDAFIKENHGYSKFFQRSINRVNFRNLTMFLLTSNWFLTALILNIIME